MAQLAAKGWVCVAINYRLAPRDPFPAQIIDVKRAIAWVREHIAAVRRRPGLPRDHRRLRGRPPRRAGGADARRPGVPARLRGRRHLGAGRGPALRRLRPGRGHRAAVGDRDARPVPRARGSCSQRWDDDPELFENASPLLRITPDAPDFFVLHGTHDTLVAVEQARLFVARLREVSQALRRVRRAARARSTPSTCSARSAAATSCAAVDRFLHWHCERPTRGRLSRWRPAMPADLLATPATPEGFMPEDEGALLHRRRGARARRRARSSRSAPTAASPRSTSAPPPGRSGGTVFTVDHHRGSEENQAGWEHHDADAGRPRARPDGHAADVPAHHRATPGSRTRWSRSSAGPPRSPRTGARRCRCCSSTAGTPRSTPSNDYTGWAPLGGRRRHRW